MREIHAPVATNTPKSALHLVRATTRPAKGPGLQHMGFWRSVVGRVTPPSDRPALPGRLRGSLDQTVAIGVQPWHL